MPASLSAGKNVIQIFLHFFAIFNVVICTPQAAPLIQGDVNTHDVRSLNLHLHQYEISSVGVIGVNSASTRDRAGPPSSEVPG